MLDELFEEFGHQKKHSGHFEGDRDDHHSENDNRFHGKRHADHNDIKHSDSHRRDDHLRFDHFSLKAVFKNKTLMFMVVSAMLVTGVVLAALLVIFFPSVKRGWAYVNANGVKGIIDAVGPLINALLQPNKG